MPHGRAPPASLARPRLESEHVSPDPPAQLADAIARRRGTLGKSVGPPERLISPAGPDQGHGELDFEREVAVGGRHERGCTLEQADGGTVVLAS
jgi:hypothetical protein